MFLFISENFYPFSDFTFESEVLWFFSQGLQNRIFLRLVDRWNYIELASKPHIPFLWGMFLRLGSISSCCEHLTKFSWVNLLDFYTYAFTSLSYTEGRRKKYVFFSNKKFCIDCQKYWMMMTCWTVTRFVKNFVETYVGEESASFFLFSHSPYVKTFSKQ